MEKEKKYSCPTCGEVYVESCLKSHDVMCPCTCGISRVCDIWQCPIDEKGEE